MEWAWYLCTGSKKLYDAEKQTASDGLLDAACNRRGTGVVCTCRLSCIYHYAAKTGKRAAALFWHLVYRAGSGHCDRQCCFDWRCWLGDCGKSEWQWIWHLQRANRGKDILRYSAPDILPVIFAAACLHRISGQKDQGRDVLEEQYLLQNSAYCEGSM